MLTVWRSEQSRDGPVWRPAGESSSDILYKYPWVRGASGCSNLIAVKCRNGKVRVRNSLAGLEFLVDKKNDKFVLSKGHPRQVDGTFCTRYLETYSNCINKLSVRSKLI